MKVLAVILSSWILFLTVLPCVDSHDSHAVKALELSQKIADDSHIDVCTPFCTCNCCSSPVISGSAPQIIFSSPIICHNTTYFLPVVPLIHGFFWQPPKIA